MTNNFMETPVYNKAKVVSHLLEALKDSCFLIPTELLKQIKPRTIETTESAVAATRLLTHLELDEQMLTHIIKDELATTTKETIFRDNSLCSIMVKEYLCIVGKDYLRSTFAHHIHELVNNKEISFEIDRKMLSSDEEYQTNLKHLTTWSRTFLNSIFDSFSKLPAQIKLLAHTLRTEVEKLFPKENLWQPAFSAFIFSRYICLAIVMPKAYGLIDAALDNKKNVRNLVLIAKIVQSVANGTQFLSYMSDLEPFLLEYRKKISETMSALSYDPKVDKMVPKTLSPSDLVKESSVIIQFLSTQVDSEVAICGMQKILVAGLYQETGPYGEHAGAIMDSYGKFKWICDEKKWFDSNETDRLEPPPNKISKFLQLVKTSGDAPEMQKPVYNPYSYATLADWIDQELQTKKFIVIVAYRGNWCMFCKKYMQQWSTYSAALRLRGAQIYGLTSEPLEVSRKTKEKWNLKYDIISDTEHTLADFYNVVVDKSPFWRKWGQFDNGMIQPGVLVISHTREIRYFWSSIPSVQNLYGARSRPKPLDVLSVVADDLESNSSSNFKASVSEYYGDVSSRRESVVATPDIKSTIMGMSLPEQNSLFGAVLNGNLESSAVVYQLVRPNKKQIREFLKKQKKRGVVFPEACPCEN